MKLIAIDLDGTLLAIDGSISEANRQAIYRAQEQGHRIAICSGRALLDIQGILQKNQIEAAVIAGNGATIYNGNILKQLAIKSEILQKLLDLAESLNLYHEVYTNEGIFGKEEGRNLLEEERDQLLARDPHLDKKIFDLKIGIQFSQHHMRLVPDLRKIPFTEFVPYKFFVYSFHAEKRQQFYREISSMEDISITSGTGEVLEVGNKQANKGFGLQYLANYYKIPLTNTIAIGDNLNDLSMFKVSGISIAMENGHEEAKRVADYVTKSWDEDGVAHALEKFVLRSWAEVL